MMRLNSKIFGYFWQALGLIFSFIWLGLVTNVLSDADLRSFLFITALMTIVSAVPISLCTTLVQNSTNSYRTDGDAFKIVVICNLALTVISIINFYLYTLASFIFTIYLVFFLLNEYFIVLLRRRGRANTTYLLRTFALVVMSLVLFYIDAAVNLSTIALILMLTEGFLSLYLFTQTKRFIKYNKNNVRKDENLLALSINNILTSWHSPLIIMYMTHLGTTENALIVRVCERLANTIYIIIRTNQISIDPYVVDRFSEGSFDELVSQLVLAARTTFMWALFGSILVVLASTHIITVFEQISRDVTLLVGLFCLSQILIPTFGLSGTIVNKTNIHRKMPIIFASAFFAKLLLAVFGVFLNSLYVLALGNAVYQIIIGALQSKMIANRLGRPIWIFEKI